MPWGASHGTLNLPDGGPSRSGPLLRPSESMQGGTPGTNPHQYRIEMNLEIEKDFI
jgi:hypothetical protein